MERWQSRYTEVSKTVKSVKAPINEIWIPYIKKKKNDF